MRNIEKWKPNRAVLRAGKWQPSNDVREVSVGSRAVAGWLISAYEEAIKLYATGALADIGCGKLPYYGIYKDLTSSVTGVDWPNSPHENPYVDVFSDLNEKIDLPDSCVDTVLCTDVLEHIYCPDRLWSEMARILRPGGHAIIGTPFYYWIHEAPHDYYRYTGFALERHASEAGLNVISIKPVGGLPHVLTDILCKAVRRKRMTRPLADLFRGIMNFSVRVAPVRRFAESSARQFPLAYVTVVSKPAIANA